MQEIRNRETWNEFRSAVQAGDHARAETLALDQLSNEGESSYWLNELGQVYLVQGRFSDALHAFDRAATADPTFIEALLNGAIVLSDLGYYPEAAARFEAAQKADADQGLSLQKRVAEMHAGVADLYAALGEWTAALDEYLRALSAFDHPSIRIRLARVCLQQKNATAALDHLEKARRADPRNAEVHTVAAQCYVLLGRPVEAREALARAELFQDRSTTGTVLRQAFQSVGSAAEPFEERVDR